MSQAERAAELFLAHEEETGRCYTRACIHNTEEGCEKSVDKNCIQKWYLTGDFEAGVGEDLRRSWKKEK